MQSGPIIAEQAEHLTIFQRTPSFSVPGYNGPLSPEEQAERKADYPRVREIVRGSALGMHLNVSDKSALDLAPEERQAEMETRWALGGTPRFMVSFADLLVDEEANDIAAEFLRDKIREVVDDPEIAELLCRGLCGGHQAPLHRQRLLRDVQPEQRQPGERPREPDRRDHRHTD